MIILGLTFSIIIMLSALGVVFLIIVVNDLQDRVKVQQERLQEYKEEFRKTWEK